MLSKDLLVNIVLSAAIIVCGTLYVFKAGAHKVPYPPGGGPGGK